MLLIVLRILYVFVCAGAVATYVSPGSAEQGLVPPIVQNHPFLSFVVILAVTQLVTVIDMLIKRKRIDTISAVYVGLLIGVLLSYLLVQALDPVLKNTLFKSGVVMLATLSLPYICIALLLQTRADFRFVIPYVEFSRDLKGGRPLVIDSSSLIDGRLFDVVETQILSSQLIVPDFVLNEVQDIADSSDKNRRTRGRRGLEVLSKLQNSPQADIKMYETCAGDFDSMTVDQRVVALAKRIQGGVITNDFNLNKVAAVQGILVINLNDVSNALKPRYIPGEQLLVLIVKTGESQGQGIGYLDDGTMVVCEDCSQSIGSEVQIVVTSALQSSAGRMIFGKRLDSLA